jgi:hypothetical protein
MLYLYFILLPILTVNHRINVSEEILEAWRLFPISFAAVINYGVAGLNLEKYTQAVFIIYIELHCTTIVHTVTYLTI